MTAVYWDTSALVKLYLRELGTREAMQARDQASAAPHGTSTLTKVETRSAVARAIPAGRVDDVLALQRRITADWRALAHIEVTDDIVDRASRLADLYLLRAADAVHLASASFFRDTLDNLGLVDRDDVLLASFDSDLNRAAAAEGFAVL